MRMVSLDLYKKEIQGFFSIPVDNLRASPFLLQYIKENVSDIVFGKTWSIELVVILFLVLSMVYSTKIKI